MSTNITQDPSKQPATAAKAGDWKYLMSRRGSSYKQLFVNGRIFTSTLYSAYVDEEEPMSIEDIAADWQIPVEAVQEAIAYYESKPQEMLDDFRRDDALAQATGINDPDYKLNPSPKLLSAQEIARILGE
jgi:hypothetical protein